MSGWQRSRHDPSLLPHDRRLTVASAGLSPLMSVSTNGALRALALEFRSLEQEPVEGFAVKLVNDDNLFEWQVAIFGPPNTLYEVCACLLSARC